MSRSFCLLSIPSLRKILPVFHDIVVRVSDLPGLYLTIAVRKLNTFWKLADKMKSALQRYKEEGHLKLPGKIRTNTGGLKGQEVCEYNLNKRLIGMT